MNVSHNTHRFIIFGVIITLVAILFLAWPQQVNAQPPIPHPIPGREDCLSCHQQGVGGAPKIPDNHAGRTNDMCQGCHSAGAATDATPSAPGIPHPLEGHEQCVDCHQLAATPSSGSDNAPPIAPIVPTPLAVPPVETSANTCVDCHQSLTEGDHAIVNDWQSSIHAKRGVKCVACHGGNSDATDAAVAMSTSAGFIGAPDRDKIPGLCASCHADVTRMRQYDLPTDQYAKYLESFHGQQLAKGDTKVATCFDCHDGHATRETNDPSASVYPFNVPALCARCHADATYMSDYGIPTNQFDLYKTSVHGKALLEKQDVRAPSCATCHGTHGAAPPGFAEVANVCGSCHTATQDYYLQSPHNKDTPETPRCVTCHGRYDVQEPSEAMFIGNEERHCGSCHEPNSPVGQSVAKMNNLLASANTALQDANYLVNQAQGLGMIVTEEESLIADARTKLITARAAQHTANLDTVQTMTDASIDLSKQAHEKAQQSVDENVFRRQAMIIAIAVIGLVIVSLILIRRELVRRTRGE